MKRHINDMKVCVSCGRPLEIGETCNCRQPVRDSPRDGLRAVCPLFSHRSSYRGRCYIVCGGIKHEYPGSEPRNEYYKRHCCSSYKLCKVFAEMKGRYGACRAAE